MANIKIASLERCELFDFVKKNNLSISTVECYKRGRRKHKIVYRSVINEYVMGGFDHSLVGSGVTIDKSLISLCDRISGLTLKIQQPGGTFWKKNFAIYRVPILVHTKFLIEGQNAKSEAVEED